MLLVARDLFKMFVLYKGKHVTRSSTVGIWSEVRLYCAPVYKYIVGRRSAVGQVSRQPALDVLTKKVNTQIIHIEHQIKTTSLIYQSMVTMVLCLPCSVNDVFAFHWMNWMEHKSNTLQSTPT